jgi:hypothetical protein
MPYSLTAQGNVPSGGTQTDVLWLPDGYQRDGTRRGVVYCHGANEIALTPLSGSLGNVAGLTALMQKVAQVYPVVMFDSGIYVDGVTNSFNNWGNPNGVTRMGQAITWLQDPSGGGAESGTVMVIGESMGHVLAMNYSQANASQIACIAGMIPVCDLDLIRDTFEPLGNHSISGAWATGTWTAPGTPPLPSGANPAIHANHSNIVSTPHRMYYASDDTIAAPSAVLALQADLGAACTLLEIGPGGHGSVHNLPPVDLLTFLAAHA